MHKTAVLGTACIKSLDFDKVCGSGGGWGRESKVGKGEKEGKGSKNWAGKKECKSLERYRLLKT